MGVELQRGNPGFISEEFFELIKRSFPPHEIKPGDERDTIMWSAGQQELIRWIEHRRSSSNVSSGS